jgi:hypothetical protein
MRLAGQGRAREGSSCLACNCLVMVVSARHTLCKGQKVGGEVEEPDARADMKLVSVAKWEQTLIYCGAWEQLSVSIQQHVTVWIACYQERRLLGRSICTACCTARLC